MDVETIRRISIEAQTKGVDESTAKMKQLADSQDAIVSSSEKQEKQTTSVERALERQRRSLDQSYRSQQQFAKALDDINKAAAQGFLSMSEQARLLDLARDKYGQAALGARALAAATSGVSAQLIALSAGAGPVGVFLSALGPWGVAAAVGFGAAATAFSGFMDIAEKTGERALAMRNLAEATGFSITEISALKREAGDLGIEGEKVQSWLERMSKSLVDARNGTGPLADSLAKINPQLLLQIEATKNNAEGWDVLAEAAGRAGLSVNKFLSEIAGKGSSQLGLLFGATRDAGGLTSMVASLQKSSGVSEEMKLHWADVAAQINASRDHLESMKSQLFPGLLDEQLKIVQSQERGLQAILDAKRAWGDLLAGIKASPVEIEAANDAFEAAARRMRAPYNRGAGVQATQVPTNFTSSQGVDESGFANVAADAQKALTEATVKATTAISDEDLSAVQLYNNMKRVNDALGSAKTIQDNWDEALKKANADLEQNKLTFDQWNRVVAATNLQFQSQKLNELIGLLGAMAPISLLVSAAQDKINKASQDGITITSAQADAIKNFVRNNALGIISMQAQADAAKVEAAALGLSIGAATAYTLAQNRLNEAKRNGQPLSADEIARIKEQAAATGQLVQQTELFKLAGEVAFQSHTQFFAPEDLAVAQAMNRIWGTEWPQHTSDNIALQIKFNSQMGQARDLLSSAASGFVKDLASGVPLMDAINKAAASLGASLIDLGIKRSLDQVFAALTGSQTQMSTSAASAGAIWNQAGAQFNAALLQAAESAAATLRAASPTGVGGGSMPGISLPGAPTTPPGFAGPVFGGEDLSQAAMGGGAGGGVFTGVTEGVEAAGGAAAGAAGAGLGAAMGGLGAALGPIALVAGIGLSIFSSMSAKKEQAKQAAAAWAQAKPQYDSLIATLTGNATGSLGQSLAQMKQQSEQLQATAAAAKDHDAQKNLQDTYNQYAARQINNFRASFDGFLHDLEVGAGPSGPFSEAATGLQDIGAKLTGLVSDTMLAFGDSAPEVNRAQAAAKDYLVTLIGGGQELSEIGQAVEQAKGRASAMLPILMQLGDTADDAAQKIQSGLTQALIGLSNKLISSAVADINSSSGLDVFNQFGDLGGKLAQQLSDAQALGAPAAQIYASVAVQAQKLVDDAKLTGAAFNLLVGTFPQFIGMIHAFVDVQGDLQKAQDAVTQGQQDLTDAYNEQSTALNQTISRLSGFIDQISQFRQGLTINPQLSPLSPQDQLAEAKKQFEQIAVRAMSGDTSAQDQLQQAAQNYLEQAKDYYGASVEYYRIFTSVQNVLLRAENSARAQLSSAQQQLTALQQQVNLLVDIDHHTMAVEDAIKALSLAQAQLTQAQAAAGGTGQPGSTPPGSTTPVAQGTAPTAQQIIDGLYAVYLHRAADPAGESYWMAQYNAGLTGQSLINAFIGGAQGAGEPLSPGYAGGGLITNGTYGVDSVTARLAGSEYIMPAAQTMANFPALEAMRAGSSYPANDNGETRRNFQTLAQAFADEMRAQTRDIVQGLQEVATGLNRRDADARHNTKFAKVATG